jgi:23S rRNA (adenine2503-C2)-methyltransferase
MGMGEPLHNEDAVYAALDRLVSQNEFALSPRRIIVSTVGICDAMIRFVTRFPRVGLAISLHTAEQQLRESLIPLARRYPLDQLQRTLREIATRLRRPMMIEYLMLQNVNDGPDAARQLADYLQGLDAHVNLIPYNPIDNGPDCFQPTSRAERDRFATILRDRGFLTTIRYSQGRDIGAACGQLIQRLVADG